MAISRDKQIEEILRCGKDPNYFIDAYVKIQHPVKGLIPFRAYDYQKRCVKDFQEHRFNIVLKSRQLGLSTVTAAYAVWKSIFFRDKNTLVIATKLESATNFIKKVKVAINALPEWLLLPKIASETKTSINFDNGSQLKAVPRSDDAGRSEALSLLIVDECVTGDTLITVRESENDQEITLSISQLFDLNKDVLVDNNNFFTQNTLFEVKTPTGWSKFAGIKKSFRNLTYILQFSDGVFLQTTAEHKILSNEFKFHYVNNIEVGFITSTGKVLEKVEICNLNKEVFDLINVEKNNQYYTNNVVSHNCAFIHHFEDIYAGLQPTLSTGGSAILISTPNGTTGVGKKYYQIWKDADAGQNDYNAIRLPWDVHPEHDHIWFENEKRQLGDAKKIAQELLCDFEQSGDTYLQPADLKWVRDQTIEPIKKDKNNKLWIWKTSFSDHRYIISADVARGDANDYSAFQVFDYDECEQVAEYMGKIPPDRFGELLIEYGQSYNFAPIVAEQNTYGYMTNVKLRDEKYPFLYYKNSKKDIFERILEHSYDEVPGFDTQKKSRAQILSKLEEVIRNKSVNIYSRRLYEQLHTFVWNNGKIQAAIDSNDDLVFATAIGVWLMNVTVPVQQNDSKLLYALMNASGKSTIEHNALSSVNNVKPITPPAIMGLSPNTVHRPRQANSHMNFDWLLR